jgi:DNA-binding NarL/FixJ family response regulator
MSKIRVVLIEDHELTRLGIRAALCQGDEVDIIGEATNATDGLKLLKVTKPDIAIVDVGLPDLDGIELTKRFKASLTAQQSPQTKVLILTMQNQEELVIAAFAAGADSYCMKDASRDKLLEALRVTHEGYAWIDPGIAQIVLRQYRTLLGQDNAASEREHTNTRAVAPDYSQPTDAYPLTIQEKELLELIVQGYSNTSIAAHLHTTVGTVKTQVKNLLDKLSVDARTEAAVQALHSEPIR